MGKPAKISGSSASLLNKEALFALPKDFKKALDSCRTQTKETSARDVTYLWIAVSAAGLGGGTKSASAAPLSVEDWLNVVDESASLGANWIVLSLFTKLSEFSEIWEICHWAQETHGMMVGLHIGIDEVTAGDLEHMKSLNLKRLRLLVRDESLERLSSLKREGITLWTANPQPDGVKPNCQGPAKMIYVNAEGNLYTCGLVEGKADYHLGSVLHDRLHHLVKSPRVRHCVEEDLHRVSPGCDGCPALIANYFTANLD